MVVGELETFDLKGNSGSSTGPHLHFQVMSRPPATDADGMPYVFRSFVLQGRIPPLSDSLFAAAARGEPLPVTGGITGRTPISCRSDGTSSRSPEGDRGLRQAALPEQGLELGHQAVVARVDAVLLPQAVAPRPLARLDLDDHRHVAAVVREQAAKLVERRRR